MFPRRAALLLPWVVAACARSETAAAPTEFAPLRYDFLTPIPLNVATVTTELRLAPGSNDLGRYDPVDPAQVLSQMGRDRLQTLGSGGRAVFIVQDASLVRSQGSYIGSFAVELDVYASDDIRGDTRGGFAEARVLRTRAIDSTPLTVTLYEMTKALMDAMNVEFEFQVRRSLRDWLIAAPVSDAQGAPPPPAPPVEQQALPPPPS